MKTTINILLCSLVFIGFTSCGSTLKNVRTESFKVNGNCGMCEKTIESAGNVKGSSLVDWDRNTKIASISYNSKKTNSSDVLKRIALAGYDNEQFVAPNEVYAKLSNCCKYERTLEGKSDKVAETNSDPIKSEMDENSTPEIVMNMKSDQLTPVFANYFLIKDALVSSDGEKAATAAKLLVTSISTIEMSKLPEAEHQVWMKIVSDLKKEADFISKTTNIERQRDHFGPLSDNMFELMKVTKQDVTIYYQHCPMANDGEGANWLSKESTIKNPFYGAKMLSCGTTVEVIKK